MSSNDRDRDTARPRFFRDAVENKAASEKEGRPIFEDKEMVEILIPGDKLFSWIGEVADKHRERWPGVYAAFKRGEERAASGTPLEHWPHPSLTKGRAAELKAGNILSVEELAGVPDNMLSKLGMGTRELRDAARAYIDQAKGGAESAAMAARIAQLEEMVQRLAVGDAKAPAAPKEKTLEDCTDEELKAYVKRETGEAPRGNPNRDTLLRRAAEVAEGVQAAA